GSIVVGKLSEQKEANFGYDAQKDKYCDLVSAGIIDPVKVVRTALQGAASVAGLMITTEATVADLPKKEEAHGHAPDLGGMGGMCGMMYFIPQTTKKAGSTRIRPFFFYNKALHRRASPPLALTLRIFFVL